MNPFKKAVSLTAVSFFLLSGCVKKDTEKLQLKNVMLKGGGSFSCTFDGVKHDFILDMPDNTENAPLVIILHGYGDSAEGMRNGIHFEEAANPLGYAVVYVTGAASKKDRTAANGWNSAAFPDDNKDTEFLTALAEYLQKKYSLDKNRIYAAGFSNGACMMHTLAEKADDTFSALVCDAGYMQKSIWDSRKSSNVSFFQLTGEKDDFVPKDSDGTAETNPAPSIEKVMAYRISSINADISESCELKGGSVLNKYECSDTHKQVWELTVKGGSHSWYSEKYNGFDANELVLEFFEAQK
ncbi:MAG: prolyl oligopeptidase family serine peptidase [Ruminococcus sp.]|uniref:alpha/beta hydrolase family esterase n=1 Tax=Ruminococcus sp. TaxID=41978 RepID=UPI0025F5DC02|nr:PHB depolymerase family esterase [Ruminococcus sp.]MCR4795529.1 prolyl oligopeptidase family serine peptidase [Ruminococcus sp.]